MNTIIETEEKERKRFSEDLHDGLGSILSTIKIYINTLHSGQIVHEKRGELVQFTNQLIDEAIQNSKEIANNLSPNIIKKFGLVTAISSLCDKVKETSGIDVAFDASGFHQTLSEDKEISIYRIISELLNNTMKHSGATNAAIELSNSAEKFNIHFSDNGKGFNFEQMLTHSQSGLGLQNIVSRVNSLNGGYKAESKKGNGYSINFEFGV